MAQIAANPWLFTSSDQATSVAISSIANNVGSILVTTSSAHGLSTYAKISLQGAGGFSGPYNVLAVPSTTTLLLANQQKNYGLSTASITGNVLTMAYFGLPVRAEQILWDQPTASTSMLLTDGYGNTIWNPSSGSGASTYTYGKVFWIQNGLVFNTLGSGNVQITIN